jgi:MoxR-like ATPase
MMNVGRIDDMLYSGNGKGKKNPIKLYESFTELDDPAKYIADPGLSAAVNVALMLGQPLLLTGEPGTGKTQLARSLAHELTQPDGSPTPLLEFHTKSTSAAKDLFYRYDALAHFHSSHHNTEREDPDAFITYEALGLAILLSLDPADERRQIVNHMLPQNLQGRGPVRSVVLIDEVDKAPRDLPNDVLNEIERMSFTVTETGQSFQAQPQYRPVLILTSNSEKDLPDAFLRRCAFYHIAFPTPDRLEDIVRARLSLSAEFDREMLAKALNLFQRIRELPLRKRPATAELLAWLIALEGRGIDLKSEDPAERARLKETYPLLAKNREDLELLREM